MSKLEEINTLDMNLSDAVIIPDVKEDYTDKIQVHVGGRKYKTLFTKKFKERKVWQEPNINEIKSIIPGVVTKILVKPKSKVKRGDKMMIYEAMKMKNIISAPFDAVVERVEVKEGDRKHKGAILVVLTKID